jgi:DNA-binding transcriptional ArsR family regulator
MKLGDMMSSEFEMRIINKPIYYIEMVALLNRLICNRSYREIKLNDNQNAFLDLLKEFRIQGCELFELYLYNQNIDDIGTLVTLLRNIKQVDFLYLLCGEQFSKEQIELLIEHFDIINEIVKKDKYLSSYKWEKIRFAFERTEEFTNILIDIFKVINLEVVNQMKQQERYTESIQNVTLNLKSKIPLDVAQGIMGKKFKRVFDFNTYYFVPSYFYINRPMRTFNEKTQIVIYPVQEANKYNKNTLANALKIIGDDKRLEIIEKLTLRPMFGKELAKELGIGTSTVSHHLDQLRTIGLINEEREKSVKYFSVNTNEYNRLSDAFKNFIVHEKAR